MIGDLEAQEFVNRRQSRFIIGSDGDSGAARGFLNIPMQFVFELGHGCGSGDVLAGVHQHRHVEISGREHLDDVVKVAANLIPAFGVFHIVRPYVDDAAILVQFEVVGGFLVRESHLVIAALVERSSVIVLGEGQSRSKYQSKKRMCFHRFKDGPPVDRSRRFPPRQPIQPVQIQVQEQDIYAGLAQESQIAAFGVGLDQWR